MHPCLFKLSFYFNKSSSNQAEMFEILRTSVYLIFMFIVISFQKGLTLEDMMALVIAILVEMDKLIGSFPFSHLLVCG